MDRYECPCGYVYDPEEGAVEANISAGTSFEGLPEDWVCPKCEAEKEYFEKTD
jgi:rubredoxin